MAFDRVGLLKFDCNICGQRNQINMNFLSREVPSCSSCGSTVRMRGMVNALSIALFGEPRALPEFPKDKSINGIGMSDWIVYADRLEEKLDYKNTFYHQEPKLDIMARPSAHEIYDFLFSSDVFEHVPPPALRAFENCNTLLKANGALVFSVPYNLNGSTLEHFPDLHDYFIDDNGGSPVLKNLTKDGNRQEFDNLIFHGGHGATLEMRVFSLPDLTDLLQTAGFQSVKIVDDPFFRYGIYWPQKSSLPIIAKKEKSSIKPKGWGPQTIKIESRSSEEKKANPTVWLNHTGIGKPEKLQLYLGHKLLPETVTTGNTSTASIPLEICQQQGYQSLTAKYAGEEAEFIGEIFFYE